MRGILAVAVAAGLAGPMAAGSSGEAVSFSPLTPDDGLSQGSVWALAQDRRGFLWLGTEGGLDRFDGVEVRPFDLDGTGASQPFVRALAVDGPTLWAGTDGTGLARLDVETEVVEILRHDPADRASLADDEVVALAREPAGRLWVGTRHRGVQRLRPDGRGFERPLGAGGDGCPAVAGDLHALLADRSGGLWVGAAGGLFRRPAEGGCLVPVAPPSPAEGLSSPQVTHLREDRAGSIWVASRGGLDRVDPARGAVVERRLAGESVTGSLETRDGALWVGLEGGGLVKFADGSAERIVHRPQDRTSLASDTVRALFEDRAGGLWVGTEQGGAGHLPAARRLLGARRAAGTPAGVRALRGVMALHGEAGGTLWVGTRDQGLFRLSAAGEATAHWRAGHGSPDPLDSGRISALAGGAPGELLVATVEGSLYRLDRATEALRRLPRFTDRSVRAIRRAADGRLWIATWGAGVFELSPRGEVLRRWTTAEGLADDIVLCLEPASDGGLWAGTWSGGLARIDPGTGEVAVLRAGGGEAGLASDRVASLLAQGGLLRVGTDRGLQTLDLATRRMRGETLLAGATVFGLLADDSGHLWAATERGLRHLDPSSGLEERFLESEGLQGDEFNVGAAVRAGPGELAFGGLSGINRFRPHPEGAPTLAFEPAVPPRLALTRLEAGPRRLAAGRLGRPGPGGVVELSSGESDLRFTAALLDFARPQTHRFAWRLEGRGEVWTELGAQRSAALYDLAPGRYILEVVAWRHGVKVPPSRLRIPVLVRPAFWQRRTVQVGAAGAALALAAGGLGGLHRRRLRRRLRVAEEALEVRNLLLAAREQERVALARELHDGPLQRIHALQLALGRSPAAAGEPLRRDLAALVAEVRQVCGRLRSPVLERFGLAAALRDLVEEAAERAPGVRFALDLPEAPPGLAPAAEEALYRVAREALANALRHGEPRSVRVALRAEGDRTVLDVADDGLGFTPPERWLELARRGHLGVLGMAERLESAGGSLAVESAPGHGTRVRATLGREAGG